FRDGLHQGGLDRLLQVLLGCSRIHQTILQDERRDAAGTEPLRYVGALTLPRQKEEAPAGTDDDRRAVGLRFLWQERSQRGTDDIADAFLLFLVEMKLRFLLRPVFRARGLLGPDGNDGWLGGLVLFRLLVLGRRRARPNRQETGPRDRPFCAIHTVLLL